MKDEFTGTAERVPAHRIAGCGDASCEFLVDPIPRPRPAPFALRLAPAERHVVLVANQKPNAFEILQLAQSILRERGIDVQEEIHRKAAGGPVSGELLERLRRERGLVLSGVND